MSTSTRLDIRPLPPALQQKAIDEVNEVPERLAADIATLRAWLLKQPHLRARTNDQFLVNFLRGCKFSLEKAKRKLDKYYTLRTTLPELKQDTFVDDQRLRAIIRLAFISYLPLPLKNGPCIILIRPGKYDPHTFNMSELLRVAIMLHDIFFATNDNGIISGITQICDLTDFTMTHFLQMNPSAFRNFGLYAEEGIPLRIKNSHFINIGATFGRVMSLLKLVLPGKIVENFVVHSNYESLYEYIPLKYLPKEYGGENSSLEEISVKAEQLVFDYREYLLEETKYGVDERLRVGGPLKFDALFGAEGSFRKLDVD